MPWASFLRKPGFPVNRRSSVCPPAGAHSNAGAITDTVLCGLDAAGLLAFMAKPGSSENRGLLWGINNSLDWGAAVAMVLAFAEAAGRDVRPGELGVLASHVLDLAKGHNPLSAPTYRWPDIETVKAIAAAGAARDRPRTSAELAAVLASTSSAWRPESLQPVFRDAASA